MTGLSLQLLHDGGRDHPLDEVQACVGWSLGVGEREGEGGRKGDLEEEREGGTPQV